MEFKIKRADNVCSIRWHDASEKKLCVKILLDQLIAKQKLAVQLAVMVMAIDNHSSWLEVVALAISTLPAIIAAISSLVNGYRIKQHDFKVNGDEKKN